MKFEPLPEDELIRAGIGIVRNFSDWARLPLRSLLKQLAISNVPYKDPNNITRALDKTAHNAAVFQLRRQFGNHLYIYGEEARTPRSLHHCTKTVAIIDAIDGTDLVARGFNNWCSAIVFFYPRERRILASVVAHSSGDIYYASGKGAFKKTEGFPKVHLHRNSKETLKLADASLCFYGQKPKNFLTLVKGKYSLVKKLNELDRRMSKKRIGRVNFRLYNFGGNPMMVKIPDRTVDAVFELAGQQVHDVIPGAYIATQAGAVIVDLNGKPINLAEALLAPKEDLKYILAATNSLSKELINALRKSPVKKRRGSTL